VNCTRMQDGSTISAPAVPIELEFDPANTEPEASTANPHEPLVATDLHSSRPS
jgi:hypothetical protein